MSRASGWEYRNPVQLVFGEGRLAELDNFVRGRVLVVTTQGSTRRGITNRVVELLGHDRCLVYDQVESNPTLDRVEGAIADLRKERVEAIVGVGGGSALDFAKVLSLALADPDFALVRAVQAVGLDDAKESLDVVAVPTTAGTGSEVTPFATIWDGSLRKKLSVTSPRLYPRVALVDPELTLSLPWEATLGPGLDAYTQCFEAIWNRNATPLTTALAKRGLDLVPAALRLLKNAPASPQARSDMAEAALLSGLAISHTRTALAHSMSYPITAHFGVPHGLACALVLPAVVAFNLETDDGRLEGVAAESGDVSLAARVADLLTELGVPEVVARYLPDPKALQEFAPEMLTPGRADNNLRPADIDSVRAILRSTEDWLSQMSRA